MHGACEQSQKSQQTWSCSISSPQVSHWPQTMPSSFTSHVLWLRCFRTLFRECRAPCSQQQALPDVETFHFNINSSSASVCVRSGVGLYPGCVSCACAHALWLPSGGAAAPFEASPVCSTSCSCTGGRSLEPVQETSEPTLMLLICLTSTTPRNSSSPSFLAAASAESGMAAPWPCDLLPPPLGPLTSSCSITASMAPLTTWPKTRDSLRLACRTEGRSAGFTWVHCSTSGRQASEISLAGMGHCSLGGCPPRSHLATCAARLPSKGRSPVAMKCVSNPKE
ncbi:unnamed protein product [Prorocentrum cordatum]|uniref:Uncharacterized protein n=1 Tax=Prorocentrum cordatum TaxID=2364126 RepID=A0ABN9T4P1_9DINO|nr:unnamed protein product [Polarella glacialis]